MVGERVRSEKGGGAAAAGGGALEGWERINGIRGRR